MLKNKTQKRIAKKKCENKFCKLYTKTRFNLFKPLHPIKSSKSEKNKIKKSMMKSCKYIFCNNGCRGTILQKGKDFPKLNKQNTQIEMYGKEFVENLRKKLFNGKTNILVDNVQDTMPKEISESYKKKGAISICDHYIPNGSIELLSKKI